MQLYHNSQNKKYRSPFGALPAGEPFTLRLRVRDGNPDTVQLRLWQNRAERLLDLHCDGGQNGELWYSINLTAPDTPCLVWYYFIAWKDGQAVYFSNRPDELGGVGEQTGYPTGHSYQITVYERGFRTPDWFKHSVMYQIFPDRFYGVHPNGEILKKRPEYHIHEDWYEPLAFSKHPYEDGPACNDFYGGNLEGIIAKLPYLKELGVSVLYLNPIFDAYSNHKYDTADYKTIDPMFGKEEDFRRLCAKAREMGIRIILDGVFSHTGSDSVYFNKYGNYGAGGAWRDRDSPYAAWYDFTDEQPGYRCWWGCSNLPNVKETEPFYLDYILREEDAVIKKWLYDGASGWRLDVADELPDEFIELLRAEVKKASPDAVIIGEVWEDASHKESYGQMRGYLFGRELDSVMNYPFKDGAIRFLLEQEEAQDFDRLLKSLRENYPKEVFYSLMNHAGTHDTMRIKSVLGEQPQWEGMTEEQKQNARLSPAAESLAIQRVRLMAFLQMTYCGVPSIYYGDEIGMQGLADPFNRMPYTWRQIDPLTLEFYRTLIHARNLLPCLRTGKIKTLYARGGVYVYARYITGGADVFGKPAENGIALCAVNRGREFQEFTLDLRNLQACDFCDFLCGNVRYYASGGSLNLAMEGLSCKLLLAGDCLNYGSGLLVPQAGQASVS